VRSFDRSHAIELIAKGVDEQVRETFESALAFSALALQGLGVAAEEAAEVVDEVRRRDTERLQLEIVGGMYAGKELLRGNGPKPTPFTVPKRAARALSEETAEVMSQPADAEPVGS
jgi:glutathione-regulated potassium-efflux system protein KefB